jgi:hypothetical protein
MKPKAFVLMPFAPEFRKRSTAHLLQGQQIVAVVGLDLQRLRRTFD